MPQDSFDSIWGSVLLRCPAAGPNLAQELVRNAFRRIVERRRWSWLIRQGQFIVPLLYNTGTVSVTIGSPLVTGVGTGWDQSMEGRQFRIATTGPIYDISQVVDSTHLLLAQPWAFTQGYPGGGVGYQIYRCFFNAPDDFHAFSTLWDPNYNWQLNLNIDQRQVNAYDSQRANFGQAYVVSFRDYASQQNGLFAGPMQLIGAGPSPQITGDSQYSAPGDATFAILVSTGGVAGTAQFTWSLNGGAMSSAVLTSAFPGNLLASGLTIYWPDTVTYTQGDLFVIQATAVSNPGVPRYELWPHNQTNYAYPFLYESRPPDISDPNVTLPRYIRGDVLMEMALGDLARWPGPAENPNPYFNMALAGKQDERTERILMELEVQDDEVYVQMAAYEYQNMPFAPLPFGDATWLQSHAIF